MQIHNEPLRQHRGWLLLPCADIRANGFAPTRGRGSRNRKSIFYLQTRSQDLRVQYRTLYEALSIFDHDLHVRWSHRTALSPKRTSSASNSGPRPAIERVLVLVTVMSTEVFWAVKSTKWSSDRRSIQMRQRIIVLIERCKVVILARVRKASIKAYTGLTVIYQFCLRSKAHKSRPPEFLGSQKWQSIFC